MSDLLRRYEPAECGADGYPFAWHAEIKHAIREAAGHRCVRCGHPYRQGGGEWSPCDEHCDHLGPWRMFSDSARRRPYLASHTEERHVGDAYAIADEFAWTAPPIVEAQWRILTVHHLTGEKADCRWWNLAALCQRCHLQIQGRVNMAQTYPHEHSEWFRPYAAGDAWAYLGEELTREETIARLDELLELERVA